MHMVEVQRSTEVGNEEGTEGNTGRGWHIIYVCVCRDRLTGVDSSRGE